MATPRAEIADCAARRRQSGGRCDVSQALWSAMSMCTPTRCRGSTTVRRTRKRRSRCSGPPRRRGSGRSSSRRTSALTSPTFTSTSSTAAVERCAKPSREKASRSRSCAAPRCRSSGRSRPATRSSLLATYGQRGTDLLIETPTFDVVGFESRLNQLRAKGLRVTLAHPERNVEFQRAPSRLADLVHDGVLLQVNAETLLRYAPPLRHAPAGALLCSRASRTRSPPTAIAPPAGDQ